MSSGAPPGRRPRLRSRIFRAFALFGACVALLFFAVGHAATHVIEDRISAHHLGIATDAAMRQVEAGAALPPPTPFAAAYRGSGSLPEALRRRAEALPPGIHELRAEGRELWVSRTDLPGGPLFVVSDLPDSTFAIWRGIVAAGCLVILAGGLAIGAATARRMARPLTELAERLDDTRPAGLRAALAEGRFDLEVQLLADRLRAALAAVDAHAERDQRFTRYASHELRSPVAVVKGAAELVRAAPESGVDRIRRPLERIERATADMEAIIEAFLWLAREGAGAAAPPPQPLAPIVDRVVERYRYLLGDKPVDVRLSRTAEPTVSAPPAVLEIVVGNLVANAFHYTERGEVAIEVHDRGVRIRDTGPGLGDALMQNVGHSFVRGEKSVGYGLGLSIALSLCERFGWQLTLDSDAGVGTRAALAIHP